MGWLSIGWYLLTHSGSRRKATARRRKQHSGSLQATWLLPGPVLLPVFAAASGLPHVVVVVFIVLSCLTAPLLLSW
ncbi:MAG: hypothetical protein ACYDAG_04805, partial [Chloroflexota bacterium]